MRNKATGPIVEGPGGLRMPEVTARRIEALSSKLPKDFTYRRMARKSDEFRLDPGERTDVSVITTDALDRDGEVVLPGGIDWSGYNRVVTFSHRYDQLPVGSNWWMRVRGNGLIAKTHYPAKPADWGDATPWLPSAVLHLMQQPVATCTGKSIGFLPLNIRQATAEERARRPELAAVPIIDKAAGLEYAVAPVPCNPDAQMQAVAKGRELGLIDQSLGELLIGLVETHEKAATSGPRQIHLNELGVTHAQQLILAGDIDSDDAWTWESADEDALLSSPPDWTRYAANFLGMNLAESPQTKAHYLFPFSKLVDGKPTLFRHALDAIRSRAAALGDDAIFAAAGRLLEKLDEVGAGKGASFVRSATIRTALQQQLAQMRPAVAQQVHQQIRDVFCAATGRVC